MEFREALDVLGIDAATAGEMFGVQAQTIRQMRLDPDKPGYRKPPEGWQATLAKVARARGREMDKVADRLERGG